MICQFSLKNWNFKKKLIELYILSYSVARGGDGKEEKEEGLISTQTSMVEERGRCKSGDQATER